MRHKNKKGIISSGAPAILFNPLYTIETGMSMTRGITQIYNGFEGIVPKRGPLE
jgi:hypothetical protein